MNAFLSRIGFLPLDLGHMEYSAIFAAMAQAVGTLIALLGIFMVFRLQIQRDRIRGAFQDLKSGLENAQVPGIEAFVNVESVLKEAEKLLREHTKKNLPIKASIIKKIRNETNTVKKERDILKTTVNYGMRAVWATTFLFIYYIIGLHLHTMFPEPLHFFLVGLCWSVAVVVYLGAFIVHVLRSERKEYLK